MKRSIMPVQIESAWCSILKFRVVLFILSKLPFTSGFIGSVDDTERRHILSIRVRMMFHHPLSIVSPGCLDLHESNKGEKSRWTPLQTRRVCTKRLMVPHADSLILFTKSLHFVPFIPRRKQGRSGSGK